MLKMGSKKRQRKEISISSNELCRKTKNSSNPTLTARHRTKKSFRRNCSIMTSIFIIFEQSMQKSVIIIFWNESEQSPATVNSWKPKSAKDGNYTISTNEPAKKDWSKQRIPEATIDCLDKNALLLARQKYKEKMNRPHITEEVDRIPGSTA